MTTEQSENSTFPFEVNGEIVDLKDKILESGKKLSEIMTPVMAHIRFDAFQEHLKKRDYKNVYTSDVYNPSLNYVKNLTLSPLKLEQKF